MNPITPAFWHTLETLLATSTVTIDRPKGTSHPRYPDFIYPLDYGYLEGTHSGDGHGIDVWLGTLPERRVTAIVCAVDLEKREIEIKILLACTEEEAQAILAIHNDGSQSALLVPREE
jgi:inorganic pyrophosphatase